MEDVRVSLSDRDITVIGTVASALAHARDLDRALARAHDLANAATSASLAGDLVVACTCAHELHDRGFDIGSALVKALASAIAGARALASDFERDVDFERDFLAKRKGRRVRVREIVAAVEHATVLTPQLHGSSAVGGGDAARAPWRVAVRVTGWLVRVLPVTDRAMYREVYWSELFELAQAARPRRAQLGYTLHCLIGVVALRRALRMPPPLPREQRG